MKKVISLCVLSLIFLTGCQSTHVKEQAEFKAKNDQLIGKKFDDLVNEFGVPTSEAKISEWRRVVEYLLTKPEVIDGGYLSIPNSTYIRRPNGNGVIWVSHFDVQHLPPRYSLRICKLDFTVTAQNLIESWKAHGADCY